MTDTRPTRWTRRDLDRLAGEPATTAPVIDPATTPRVLPEHDIWDLWPVQREDGTTATVREGELWMTLSAPAVGHPEHRHDIARLHLLARAGDRWTDLGHVFPDGASPGSREWSGSALLRPDGTVSVIYTATGERGEARPTFHQRVVEARPRLITDGGATRLARDAEHRVVLRSDGLSYLPADEIAGGPGRIRAFRDPAWFRDPADGVAYLLVAASVPWRDRFMGAVALARETAEGWSLCPPLLVADGVNHEIERPHVVVHRSRYHLFFCTSRQSFHPPGAPTGLYGFVAPSLTGPYEPLNGSGLVVRNPPTRPDQAYAWWVLGDLSVVSFVNYLLPDGSDPRQLPAAEARAAFGGTVAPVLDLTLDHATAHAVPRAGSDPAPRPAE
ncbi:glycoside hydrolase family 68 protein [Streptomyces millisiae]|uniref:Glycoside hydrolase family 68 protein n=1 Tax=Streptomyces millisiae TaxID=3075542 RepID=A0ABU2LN42_9ACTN|nr:glycoside hydrolase family 68 protein [Streptomyces sp. DSM 44918]MDT0319007.1 glycoside hydrolase family 68 protein [Streptomyces sp. DSM 44918]